MRERSLKQLIPQTHFSCLLFFPPNRAPVLRAPACGGAHVSPFHGRMDPVNPDEPRSAPAPPCIPPQLPLPVQLHAPACRPPLLCGATAVGVRHAFFSRGSDKPVAKSPMGLSAPVIPANGHACGDCNPSIYHSRRNSTKIVFQVADATRSCGLPGGQPRHLCKVHEIVSDATCRAGTPPDTNRAPPGITDRGQFP